jgi:hypothetical protein
MFENFFFQGKNKSTKDLSQKFLSLFSGAVLFSVLFFRRFSSFFVARPAVARKKSVSVKQEKRKEKKIK